MESDSNPELSSEYSHAHKIAAKELIKYCQEFDRWRTAAGCIAGLAQDPRKRGMLAPRPAERPAPGTALSTVVTPNS